MKNYTAQDIEAMYRPYEKHITHVVVAHTLHRPYIASTDIGRFKNVRPDQYVRGKMIETSDNLRHALNCFNKMLYPAHSNRPKQNPFVFKPLTFVTIEGAKVTTDRSQTIHVNISLGNLPSSLNADDIETLFRYAWHNKAHQSSNVKAYDYKQINGESRWMGYSLKEAQQNKNRSWDTDSIWDVSNCWIPHDALQAD